MDPVVSRSWLKIAKIAYPAMSAVRKIAATIASEEQRG